MIRWIYDNWAGTYLGLLFNIIVFGITFLTPVGLLETILFVYGFGVLAIFWYGYSKGWNIRE